MSLRLTYIACVFLVNIPTIESLNNYSNTAYAMIPVRMLTQFAYCNRLGYLEWVQNEFQTSADVEEGTFQHRVVDSGATTSSDDTIHTRSVLLSDGKLDLTAKIDLLEIDGDTATPIEYKKGSVPNIPGGVYDSTMIQVCAQGLLLRANGYTCDKGVVYYVASKKRVEVRLDDILVAKTLQATYDMKTMVANNTIPPPLLDSPKCPRCSLVGICLPDETNALQHINLDKTEVIRSDSVRRLYPIRLDSKPVYVQEQGAYISVSGNTLQVKSRDGTKQKIRMIDISGLTIYGNIQITTQAVRRLCEEGIPVCYLSYGGRIIGMTNGHTSKNIDLRIRQHRIYEQKSALVKIARSIVRGKILNCMTLLRRNHTDTPEKALDAMAAMAERCKSCRRYNTLLGIEGMAAKMYFAEFGGMLKRETEFDFNERNRRPPKDPVNAMLSFLYMMLLRQTEITVATVGFDPYLGFLHTPHHGRASLALDMMEEFRPVVCDSVCITLINSGSVKPTDFTRATIGIAMNDTCKRKVIMAFESRMNETIRHRLLGYSASYRRILETQVRLLARHVMGEIPEYPPFRVR